MVVTKGAHAIRMTDVLVAATKPPRVPRKADRWPVYKTIVWTLEISLYTLIDVALRRLDVKKCDAYLDMWAGRIFRSGNATVSVDGRSNFEAGKPYVVMSNHASLIDVPAMCLAVPGSLRMVTKEEMTKVPIWGRAIVASGFVPVDRKNREKAIAQLERAKERLATGISIWVSPEGTRSRDGKLAAFKKGGFHVARDLGVPIIPAWIDGAADILPPDSFVVRHDGTCTVRFGSPIN